MLRTIFLSLGIFLLGPHAGRAYFTPDSLSGLVIWLKADAGVMTNSSGVVTNWLDQKNNIPFVNSAASPIQPTVVSDWRNGQMAIRQFTNLTTGLQSPINSTSITQGQARTVFFALSVADRPATDTILGQIFGTGNEQNIELSNYSRTNRVLLRSGSSGTYFLYSPAGSVTWNNPHILCARSDSAGNVDVFLDYVTNVIVSAAGTPVQFFSYSLTPQLGMGWACYTAQARSFRGDLAEFLLYDRALTVTEIADVFYYFGLRYRIPPSFTVKNPGTLIYVR